MTEPAQKAILFGSKVYSKTAFIAFKKAYACCLSLGEKLTYSRFRPKTFYNIGTREEH